MAILRTKTITQAFRDLKVGQKTKLECTSYTTPFGFANAANIKIKTRWIKQPKDNAGKYLIEVTREK